MFSNARKINFDGSRNVHCSRCKSFISVVSGESVVYSALCVICQLADEGITPTEEQRAQLKAVYFGGATLSHEAAFPKQVKDPMVEAAGENEIEASLGRTGYFLKALVNIYKATVAEIKAAIPESKKLAVEKRSKRIFDRPLDSDDKDKK